MSKGEGNAVQPMELKNVSGDDSERKRRKKERKLSQDSKNDHARRKRKKRESPDDAPPPSKKKSPTLESHSGSSNTIPQPSQAAIDTFMTSNSITINSTTTFVPFITFNQLQIPPQLKASLKDFHAPTPIQACTWPPALDGRDVVGIAETGSGKTLGFGIPALSHVLSLPASKPVDKPPISALVLSPTRELALQTHETLASLAAPFLIASVCLFGGVPKEPQIKTLKNMNKDGMKTRIVVGTPGRILDLTTGGICDLSQVTYLVLDEADRMLDRGFENDIRAIISHTKQGADRQTMMFSATWPESVRRLARSFQMDPVRVTVGSDDLTANSHVEQALEVFDDAQSKDTRLLSRLRSLSKKKSSSSSAPQARILIFALYKKEASRVESMLRRNGYTVGALHGDMNQVSRMKALDAFRDGSVGLLVATDVAARGLDIPDVEAVINYTFPLTIEDYIHRIGRTGRGGQKGKSITFFTGDNHERALAGELARVLREGGFDQEADRLKTFPMTIKKKTHSVYGAFFRDDVPVPKGPTKIVF